MAAMPAAEHNHVYDTILAPEAASKGTDLATAVRGSPAYKAEEQDAAVTQQQQQQQTFVASKDGERGYCPAADKERPWSLEASSTSSPISTIAGAIGPLAGLQANGMLCPTVIDSQGPTPKVELVDCLFRLPTPDFRDLPDRFARPPPCYPRGHDPQQEASRPEQTLVVTTATSSSSSNCNSSSTASSAAGGGGGDHSEEGGGARLRNTPDYMEVLDRSYQF